MKCNSILSMSTFFKHFIFNSNSHHLSPKEQKVVKLVSGLFSLLTLSLLPRLCQKLWANKKVEVLSARYHEVIKGSPDPWDPKKPEEKLIRKIIDIPCHQIINGLFLGNSTAFVEASYQKCKSTLVSTIPVQMDTANPNNFKRVITLCPLAAITGDYPDLDDPKLNDRLSKTFHEKQVDWRFLGKALADSPEAWKPMVYDATYPDSKLAQKGLDVKKGMQIEDFEKLTGQKSKIVEGIEVQDWFDLIFEEIDEAVFEGKRTLVHCQAGQSRSATLLAAYIINRFHVSSDQAIAYLRTKRLCVNSKFSTQLQDYAKALSAA